MKNNWQNSILLLTSTDPQINRFGTGFLFFQNDSESYVLTCAHVIKDIGGQNKITSGNIKATMIDTGSEFDIDIAILKFKRFFDKEPLPLNPAGKKGNRFITAGFQLYGKDFLIRTLKGNLGEQVWLENRKRQDRISAWDLKITDSYKLQPGYSGSPIIDEKTGFVLGIVSHRQDEGERGLAISIDVINIIWQERPANLFQQNSQKQCGELNNHFWYKGLSIDRTRDWGDAPDVPVFFGRTDELGTLEQWIIKDHCRLVAIIGMAGIGKTRLSIKLGKGGIGKTDLSLKLVESIQNQFEYIIWRRLLNAPPLTDILSDLIKFLSNQKEIKLPDTIDEQISRLIYYLKKHRCLVILDNVESILKSGHQYLDDYEGYGRLFIQIGETPHNSCMILTSREKPPEIGKLDGKNTPVRTLELEGLNYNDTKKIFEEIGTFHGSDEEWKLLNEFYNGNPLAIELAAKHINEVFFGSISEFLNEGKPVFSDLRELLDWHFNRLSELEKEVVFWLVIEREPVLLSQLKNNIITPLSKNQLPSTIQSLQRLLPLEKSDTHFTLQPVLIEYITDKIIDVVCEEIKNIQAEAIDYFTKNNVKYVDQKTCIMEIKLLNSHALLKATAKEYLRESQIRLIIKPLIDRLTSNLEGNINLENLFIGIVLYLIKNNPKRAGYVAGNIINILCQFKKELNGYNFSNLSIWQAYLQGAILHNINFAYCNFSNTVFTETFDSIYAVALSQNGSLLAAGASNGEIVVWGIADGKQILTLEGHTNWVRSASFSPDNKILASGSGDQSVRLWDINTGQCLKILQGHTSRIYSVAFSPNGRIISSSSGDNTIRLWDFKTGNCIKILQGHTNVVWTSVFNTDGSMIASCGDDNTIRLWRVDTGECIKIIDGHKNLVWTVAFHPNKQIIASGSNDKTVRLWDINTGKCLKILKGHTDWVRSIMFNFNGSLLTSSSNDKTVRIWDINKGQCIKTLQGHTKWVRSVAFNPDGESIISGSDDQMIKFWDVKTGQCIKTLQGHTHWMWAVAIHPNNKLIASGSNDQTVRLWDVSNGKCIRTFKGHTHWIWSVAFSPDGLMLASGSNDQTIRLWDINSGRCVKILKEHTLWVWSVDFSFDSKLVASCSDDQTIKIWNTTSGSCIRSLKGSQKGIRAIAFSPIEKTLASCGDDKIIYLWNINNGQLIRKFEGHNKGARAVTFNAEGSLLASSSDDHTIKLWNINTGQCLRTLKGHSDIVRAIRFNPSGILLISCSDDNTLRLWDINTGKCLNIFHEHTSPVRAVDFSNDGKFFSSGSIDGTIKLWEIDTGNCINTLRVPRPYEGIKITGATGLTEAQKDTLKALGAVEE